MVEINVLLRMQTIQELKQFTSMMEAWPALANALNSEKTIVQFQTNEKELQEAVNRLQQEKNSLDAEIAAKKRELQPPPDQPQSQP
jgi:hypothetical protein